MSNESDIAIQVENLTKIYKLYDYPKHRLFEAFHPLRKKYHRDFYALNDVTFEVKKGETVGIIGKNGSGKSTLLQVITGVLTPSSGTVTVNGRVSALLELGAGFNPEFTGVENIYFNGSIMGYSRDELDSKVDDILSFADIGEFAYQPVKMYSSGMFVRLAFAVAVIIDPEILIVDEALSVGDIFFQQKCILKMRKMMDRGVTTLFVSHDPGTIQSLCNRGVLIQNGKIMMIDDAKTVSMEYFKQMHNNQNEELKGDLNFIKSSVNQFFSQKADWVSEEVPEFFEGGDVFVKKFAERYGDDQGWIINVKVLNSMGVVTNSIGYKEKFTIRVYITAKYNINNYCIGFRIWDDKGLSLAGTTNSIEKIQLPDLDKEEKCIIDFGIVNIFAAGQYSVSVGLEKIVILNSNHFILDSVLGAEVFQIRPPLDPQEFFLTKVYVPVQINSYTIKNNETR